MCLAWYSCPLSFSSLLSFGFCSSKSIIKVDEEGLYPLGSLQWPWARAVLSAGLVAVPGIWSRGAGALGHAGARAFGQVPHMETGTQNRSARRPRPGAVIRNPAALVFHRPAGRGVGAGAGLIPRNGHLCDIASTGGRWADCHTYRHVHCAV